MAAAPNIILIMTDQQRGDCLGIDGHPVVQTPHIDELATRGALFKHAYSSCPLCMPARRTLLTGLKPSTHGLLANIDREFQFTTLPALLRDAGYQTHLVGKIHTYPKRKRYGFDSMTWSDGPYEGYDMGDYGDFLCESTKGRKHAVSAHGATLNSWIGRPWHLEDRLHFTNWVTDKALEFLEKRDPTAPYFLKVSYFHPHQPVTCPEFYFNRYMNQELPAPVIGDWCDTGYTKKHGYPVRARKAHLPDVLAKQFRAGYYGCINHIDDQIGRILDYIDIDGAGKETLILFTSDHGEMLGDHNLFGKRMPYEASARIPFIIKPPDSFEMLRGVETNEVVELMDILPSVLDFADVEIPEGLDGRSVVPLLRKHDPNNEKVWRSYIHGECAHISKQTPDESDIMHYITNGRRKFIWFPMREGSQQSQQFFDLENDPDELHDEIHNVRYTEEIACLRDYLIEELSGRPEGFIVNGALTRPDTVFSVLPDR